MAAKAVPIVPNELMSISMSPASSAAAPPASYLRRFSVSLQYSNRDLKQRPSGSIAAYCEEGLHTRLWQFAKYCMHDIASVPLLYLSTCTDVMESLGGWAGHGDGWVPAPEDAVSGGYLLESICRRIRIISTVLV